MSTKPAVLWAYTYRLDPPQPAARLKGVRVLLAREHAAATERAGTWEGRLVSDERVSHILVLADSPDLTAEVNKRLEIALQSISAGFNVTVPMVLPATPVEELPPKE